MDEKDLDKRKIFMSESKMNTSIFNQSQLLSNSVDITQFDNSYIGKQKLDNSHHNKESGFQSLN